jgi:multicomponent Na+:H+ antiporter subunit E
MNATRIKAILHRTALFGAIWAVLTAPGAEGLAAGLVVVPAAVWLSLHLMPARHPVAVWRLGLHLPRFLWGSVIGGIDVARRAFARDLPLNPGWIELPTDLPDGGRVALGGELSLMPGTLAAGSHEGRLLVHLLDTEAGFDRGLPREEAEIAAILGAGRAPGGRP